MTHFLITFELCKDDAISAYSFVILPPIKLL